MLTIDCHLMYTNVGYELLPLTCSNHLESVTEREHQVGPRMHAKRCQWHVAQLSAQGCFVFKFWQKTIRLYTTLYVSMLLYTYVSIDVSMFVAKPQPILWDTAGVAMWNWWEEIHRRMLQKCTLFRSDAFDAELSGSSSRADAWCTRSSCCWNTFLKGGTVGHDRTAFRKTCKQVVLRLVTREKNPLCLENTKTIWTKLSFPAGHRKWSCWETALQVA